MNALAPEDYLSALQALVLLLASFALAVAVLLIRREPRVIPDKISGTARIEVDGLTGLPNRVLLRDRLCNAIALSRRNHHKLAVLFCDLDRFKTVNDTYGHEAGDALLLAVASRLTKVLRNEDLLARFGGDEFVVLCEDVGSAAQAEAVAERISRAFVEPFEIGGREFALSVSIGVAMSSGGDVSPERILRDADTAMYRAKAHGRGCSVAFDKSMDVERLQREATLKRLSQALDKNQLCLMYQPVIDIVDRQVVRIEALLRWADPKQGLVPPADFIPMLEETGLIVPVGNWVLEQACLQATQWRDTFGRGGASNVSVNVSGLQLAEPNFAEVVSGILEATGTEPSQLCLEITEAGLMGDVISAWSGLRTLKALGVTLALDDFGTGYSSLSYVRNFALDQLKIDQSFVRGMTSSTEDAAIVAAICDMAHALGLTTIAEGVETPEQLEKLRHMRCDQAQGYLFSRPQLPEVVEAYLADQRMTKRGKLNGSGTLTRVR